MNHSFQNIGHLANSEKPTIFLPGWAFGGSILELIKPLPPWTYPGDLLDPETIEQDLLSLIVSKKAGKIRLIGWSMGAMLGLQFASRHLELIDSLVLVSCRAAWPSPEIKRIRAEFNRNPEEFLTGFYRKCFLGEKEMYRNFRSSLEPLYLAGLKKKKVRLQRGLDFLGSFEIPAIRPDIPTRLVHGRQDIIAPIEEMLIIPDAHMEVINHAGHCIFLHEDSSLQQERRKLAIRAKFSKAADSYDKFAKVQAEVAQRLANKLSHLNKRAPIKTILEIGCGTGNFTSKLAARYPAAKIVALDFSPEMIAKARRKRQCKAVTFICAEGESFLEEAPSKSYDLVASNGALQWFSDIDTALQNIARILTQDGSMYCSIFGPESLKELGLGLHAIEPATAGLAAEVFPRTEKLHHALKSHFKEWTGEEELVEKKYSSALDLLQHIKKTGTSGWGRNLKEPLTPSRLQLLDQWFKKMYGACRVTYQIFYLRGTKPV